MRLILFIIVVFQLLACTTPARIKLPGNSFQTPEASGDLLSGEISARWIGSSDVKVVDNILEASPQTTPDIGEEGAIGYNVILGLTSFFDIYYYSQENLPYVIGGKIQILGDSLEQAKRGNLAIGLFAATAFGKYTNNEEKGEGSEEVQGEAVNDYSGFEAGVSVGYRARDKAMIYLTGFHFALEGETEVTRKANEIRAVTALTEGKGETTGIALGIYGGGKIAFVKVEGAYAKSKWTRTLPTPEIEQEFEELFAGISAGFAW